MWSIKTLMVITVLAALHFSLRAATDRYDEPVFVGYAPLAVSTLAAAYAATIGARSLAIFSIALLASLASTACWVVEGIAQMPAADLLPGPYMASVIIRLFYALCWTGICALVGGTLGVGLHLCDASPNYHGKSRPLS